MDSKPRIGLILIRSEGSGWADAQAVLTGTRADADKITARLRQEFELRDPWVIDGPEAQQECQRALREAELDMVVLAYQTVAGEEYLAGLFQAIGSTPLVVWCYLPWRRFPQPASPNEVLRGSGPVGTFGALGVLRNLGASFFFTFGSLDDPRLIRDLCQAGRAARLRRALRSARFGLVNGSNEGRQSSFVDEFRLIADIGPLIQNFTAAELDRAARAPGEAQVGGFLEQVYRQFDVSGVAPETLASAARSGLGLARLAAEHRLDVLAVGEVAAGPNQELHNWPVLYPGLAAPETLFLPVAELGAATASYILHYLAGSPVMALEMWFWDEPRNLVVGGHLGMQNPALAAGRAKICSDHNTAQVGGRPGIQLDLMARPGRVTLLQLRATPDGWQAIAASGVSLEGRPWVASCSHAVVRLDAAIDQFLHGLADVGAARHWIMAYGSVIPQIESLCQMIHVPFKVFQH